MSYDYIDSLDATARQRYNEKLDLIDSDCCPWQLPADAWQENAPDVWPPLSHYAISYHLVHRPGKCLFID